MTTPDVIPLHHPRGRVSVPGSPGWVYDLDQGVITSPKGVALEWCPVVTERLTTTRDDGTVGDTYYRLIVAGDETIASHEEVSTGKLWHRLAVPGTGTRTIREVLANVISGQGARLPRLLAVTRTGWHRAEGGGRMYVYPDGRTWSPSGDGRAHLIGMPERLAAMARPAPDLSDAEVRAALEEITECGGWAPLVGIAAGARSLGHSLRPVSAALVIWGDPSAGKTSTAAAGRMLMLAPHWPPVVTGRMTDTITDLEMSVDSEADMPTLLDDLALTADASQAEQRQAREILERIIRPAGNAEAIRGRRKRDLTPMDRRYVRSIPVITAQQLPRSMQASLYRRAVVLHLRPGDCATLWWTPADKGGAGGADRCGPALRVLADRIIARLGAAEDPGAILGEAERRALAALGPAVDKAAPGWGCSADGMHGVVYAAAGMLAGLVLIAEAAGVDVDPLLDRVTGPVARCLAEQADTITDRRRAADDLPMAVGDVIRRALLDRRAHIADASGDVGPGRGPDGLTPTEMGLRGGKDFAAGLTAWEGQGVRLHWLPAYGGVGVKADGLYDLCRASGDPRVTGYTSRSLAAALGRAEALLTPQGGGRWAQQVRLTGAARPIRMLIIKPEVIWTDQEDDDGPQTPADPQTPAPEPAPVEPGPAGSSPAARPAPEGGTPATAASAAPTRADQQREALPVQSSGRALAVAGDEHGIYLGDGRALNPGQAYTSMSAFLRRVVELMPDGGTVAITAGLARVLGYPDKPQNARPGRVHARKEQRPTRSSECRAAADAAAEGWQHSAAGIGAWTMWHGPDRPSIAVVVLGWLDYKRMGVSGEPYLRSDHDPVTAAYLLGRYQDLTGVPYTMTAGTSGLAMIRREYAPGQGRRRTPLLKWTGEGTPAEDVQEHAAVWTRPPTDDERAMSHVIVYDARMAYLAATAAADLAVNALEHVGIDSGFDPNRAGYWLVSTPGRWQPYPMLPPLSGRGGDKAAWLTTPTVRLLLEHGMPEEAIVDAWLSPGRTGHTARLLRRPAERLRDAVADLVDAPAEDAEVRAALKATYREMVGMLRRGTAWGARPDWADTIIATARVTLLRKAIRVGVTENRWPLKIDTDSLYYAASTPDPVRECPAGLSLYAPEHGAGLGKFTPKRIMTMDDFLAEVGS